jgi:hypothetical protein
MKAHGLGAMVIAKALGIGRFTVHQSGSTRRRYDCASLVASTDLPSAPLIYWVAHHLTSNELIRIVALVVAISPDRKAICRLALPVRPGAKPV